jgi:hypothetical protein
VGLLDRAGNALKLVVGEPGERRIALEKTRGVDDASMEASLGLGEPKPSTSFRYERRRISSGISRGGRVGRQMLIEDD